MRHPLAVGSKAFVRQQFLHLQDPTKNCKVGIVASSDDKELAIFCFVCLQRATDTSRACQSWQVCRTRITVDKTTWFNIALAFLSPALSCHSHTHPHACTLPFLYHTTLHTHTFKHTPTPHTTHLHSTPTHSPNSPGRAQCSGALFPTAEP